jgi:serine/threonine-protein kinase
MTDLRTQLQEGLSAGYTLERELGRGGMATVFLARDLKHDRPVALKVLHPELAMSLGPERFLREIKLAARLQHPHILTVLDSGETAGRLWFTMPFVEGEACATGSGASGSFRSRTRSGSPARRRRGCTTPTATA